MVLAFWDDGAWQDAGVIALIVLAAYLLIMWVAALVWAYRDVQSRTRDVFTQVVSVMLVLVFNIPGLLLYLILRPKESLADNYDRQLEAEALLHEIHEQPTCPTCRRRVRDEFVACPYCRMTLRTPCEQCGRPLASGWVVCPYCASERAAAIAPMAPVRALEAPGATAPEAPIAAMRRARRSTTVAHTPPAAPADSLDAGS